jgi:hypothetical protein
VADGAAGVGVAGGIGWEVEEEEEEEEEEEGGKGSY